MIKPRINILLASLIFCICICTFGVQAQSQASTEISNEKLEVKGTVIDAATQEPLAGVSVIVPSFSSVYTLEDGSFTIKVPSLSSTLFVNYSNGAPKEVAIRGRQDITILVYDKSFETSYEEVITATGTNKRSSLSFSNSKYDGNEAGSKLSVAESIGGQFSGVRTLMRSGAPGVGGNTFIRGYNSIQSSTQPLIVVDGMIMETETFSSSPISGLKYDPLTDLNPHDIANITVLKDGSSLYGAKAANGVIIIQTTKAEGTTTKVDFFAQGGLNIVPQSIPVMGANSYKTYLVDQLAGSGMYTADDLSDLDYLNENPDFTDYNKYHNNTDWQDEIFANSFSQDYNFRVSGGDEIAKYALSIGFMDNQGVISNTSSQRLSTRFNAESQVTKRLSINTNFGVGYQTNYLFDDGMVEQTSPIYNALVKSPLMAPTVIESSGIFTSLYDDVDPISGYSNPSVLTENVDSKNLNYSLFGSFSLGYDITDDIKLTSQIGAHYVYNRDDVFTPSDGVSTTVNEFGDVLERASEARLENYFSFFNDTRLTYNFDLEEDHNFRVMAGTRYKLNDYENSYSTSGNSGDDEFTSLEDGDKTTNITNGSVGDWKYLSFYSNINYGFMHKYFLDLNMAYDGSSRFGTGSEQFGFFPSLGASWLVSSETFMKDIDVLSQLKVRASYGIVGNDQVGNYNSTSYFVSNRFLGGSGLVSGNISNSSLCWEETRKANLGVDLSLFDERVQFNVDVYKHVTDKLLTPVSVSPAFGYSSYLGNDGQLQNTGVDFGFYGRIINTKDLKWDVSGSISTYKNEVTKLANGSQEYYVESVDGTVRIEEGAAIGQFYGLQTAGIYNTTAAATAAGLSWEDYQGNLQSYVGGDVQFVDQNGDNIINDDDRVAIGNANPDFTGMFNTSVTYKDFALSALFTFSEGNDIYNALRRSLESMDNLSNQSTAVENRWQVEGQETDIPRADYGDEAGNAQFSDRWIEDGSYIRLKTLTLSYSPNILENVFNDITFHISGNNLWTKTDYLGYDPEVSMSSLSYYQGIDAGYTPQFKSVFLGVKIGL